MAQQAQTIVASLGENLTLELATLDDVELARDAQSLVITNAAGEQTLYKGFFESTETGLPKQLTLADGTIVSMEEINALIDLGTLAPAAGGGATGGATGGGAGFAANQLDPIGEGLEIEGLLEGASLNLRGPVSIAEDFITPALATAMDRESACVEKFNDAVDGYLTSWKAPIIPASLIDDSDIAIDDPSRMVGDEYGNNTKQIAYNTDVKRNFSEEGTGHHESAALTNDLLDRSGDTDAVTLIGDVLLVSGQAEGGLEIDGTVTNSLYDSSNVVAHQFDDILFGGAGDDLLVGDIAGFAAPARLGSITSQLGISNAIGSGAKDSLLTSFSDSLSGGGGNDVIVGDVIFAPMGSEKLDVSTYVGNGFFASERTVVSQFSDVLKGDEGNDLLIGDIALASSDDGSSTHLLTVGNQYIRSVENSFSAFSDHLMGGAGDDVLVGDVAMLMGGSQMKTSKIEVFNYGKAAGNRGNSFAVFDDNLDGGDGNDLIVGDNLVTAIGKNLFNPHHATNAISLENNVRDGDGGSTYSVFNDLLSGGSGDDTLIGDNYYTGFGANGFNPKILASNSITGSSDNEFSIFSDVIDGGTGTDLIVGDFVIENPGGASQFTVTVANSVSPGKAPSENNSFAAFNDSLYAGETDDAAVSTGESLVVGDFYITDSIYTLLNVNVLSGLSKGDGQTTEAFNDDIVGSQSDDILVGDFMMDDGGYAFFKLYNEGQQGMSAFNDHICGGDGDDLIVGDFYSRNSQLDYDLPFKAINLYDKDGNAETSSGDPINIDLHLFQDTLMGEAGDDTLIGGFGRDTLSGGDGDDTFLYQNAVEDGHDTITDFIDGDVTDLDALFDQLGIKSQDDRADMVVIEQAGGNSVLTVENSKGDVYEDFSITFEGALLSEGNVADLQAQGILVGDLS